MYLFHELPEDARQKSVSEIFRVLKPGGMAILTDGTQLGDRPVNDPRQGNFEAFNEPNWGTHVATNYGDCPLHLSLRAQNFAKPQVRVALRQDYVGVKRVGGRSRPTGIGCNAVVTGAFGLQHSGKVWIPAQ